MRKRVEGVDARNRWGGGVRQGFPAFSMPRSDAAPLGGSNWPNEPAGWTLISDMPFTVAFPSGSDDQPYTDGWGITGYSRPQMLVTRVNDGTAPLSSPWVAQFSYPTGFTDGTEPGDIYRDMAGGTELYVGFKWKVSNPWQQHPTASKICFVFLGGGGSGGQIFFGMWGTPMLLRLTTELSTENTNYDSNVTATPVSVGDWHTMELYLRQSPSLVEWWMDGVLQGQHTSIVWPVHDFNQFQLAPTWGGNVGATKSEDDFFWYDHVRLSKP